VNIIEVHLLWINILSSGCLILSFGCDLILFIRVLNDEMLPIITLFDLTLIIHVPE
jgi:hypothetical protein